MLVSGVTLRNQRASSVLVAALWSDVTKADSAGPQPYERLLWLCHCGFHGIWKCVTSMPCTYSSLCQFECSQSHAYEHLAHTCVHWFTHLCNVHLCCRKELERQIAEREESIVNEDTAMTAAERKINAPVLKKAVAASPACCVCGQCPQCCAWQQTRSKLAQSACSS